jgi:POT family proton-dependent oligopeptide transporter
MLLGAVVFVLGKPFLLGQGEPPRLLTKKTEWSLYGIGIASIAVIWGLVQYQDIIQNLLIVSGIALLGYVLYSAFKLEPHARDRMFAILFLIALNPVFWGLFEQAGGSLNLYTDRYVDRGGVPASLFQSINPIYIVLLGPIFAWLWVWLAKRGWEPSAPAKFGLALVQVGLSFLVFVWGAQSVGVAAMTPVLFVFLIYFLQTTGELCLSPVGLSAMNRLAPKHLASLIMGAWFYMTAVGNFVAGKIGEATGGHGGEMTKEATLAVYTSIGWWTVGIAVAVLAVSPIIKRLMHLDTLKNEGPAPVDPRPEEGLRPAPSTSA